MHCMYCSFTPRQVPCTDLKWASSFLNIVAYGCRNSLSNHTLCCFPNPYWSHSRALINWQATRADIPLGSTYSEQRHLAVFASESHKSADVVLKEVHIRFHAVASRPEGPAAPSIFNTVLRISCPSITSIMTGCGSGGGESGLTRDDCLGGCLGGCFCSKASRTVSKLSFSGSMTLFN